MSPAKLLLGLACALLANLPAPAGAAKAPAQEPAVENAPPPATAAEVEALKAKVAELEARAASAAESSEAARAADAEAREARLTELESRLAAVETAEPELPPQKPGKGAALGGGIQLSGYVQGQYASGETSEDQLAQGGKPLNVDGFVLRRARLKLAGDWEWAALVFELKGSGYGLNVRRGFAQVHWKPEPDEAPLLALSVGVLDQPFGHELLWSSKDRWWMERSTAIRSLFAGPEDVGAVVSGEWRQFHWAIGAMNGEPSGIEGGFPGLDPTGGKDLFVRAGVDVKASQVLRISGDVSAMTGEGLERGTDAMKARIEWRDDNENGTVEPTELSGVPAVAATPSTTYDRWAVGADLQVSWDNALGTTHLYGEVVLAENLDKARFRPAPEATGRDSREFGWYAGLVQEFGENVFAGVRYDVYDPDSDLFDERGGQLFEHDASITTISPVVGLMLPDRARLSFQYDLVDDALARDRTGVPTDLANDGFTVRLQVQL